MQNLRKYCMLGSSTICEFSSYKKKIIKNHLPMIHPIYITSCTGTCLLKLVLIPSKTSSWTPKCQDLPIIWGIFICTRRQVQCSEKTAHLLPLTSASTDQTCRVWGEFVCIFFYLVNTASKNYIPQTRLNLGSLRCSKPEWLFLPG